MKNLPFMLAPAYKDYLWGGSRLNDDFGKNIESDPLAETWECSTHPAGQSTVASGMFVGETLRDMLKRFPEYLGTHSLQTTDGEPVLPILVKLIDAYKDLSVQVHPDDEYAKEHEGDLGKTEMWYVLQAKRDSSILYGFNQDMDKERVRDSLKDGSILRYLNKVPVRKNDVFYIESGTVHAIGKGTLIAEIQESSDVTYRFYDYDREDKYGNKRELHIEKALEVTNYKSSSEPKQPMRVLKYRNGYATELLTRCKYFQVERMLLNTEIHREYASYQTESNSFHALLCTDGCGTMFGENFSLNFFKGDCIFVPADSIPLKLHGRAQLLDVSC